MTWRYFLGVLGAMLCGTAAMVATIAAILGMTEWLEPTWSRSAYRELIRHTIYGLLAIAGIAAYIAGFYALLRLIRFPTPFDKPPQCKSCGYNLTGNVSGICPECGTAVEQSRA